MEVSLNIRYPLSDWFDGKSQTKVEETLFQLLTNELQNHNPQFNLNPSLKDLPQPSSFLNIEAAAKQFVKFIRANQKILILGDYDVDGVTSTALIIRFFKKIAFENFDYFIPNRFQHGYGLTPKAVLEVKAREPQLVVTVDNGITAKEEVEELKRCGVDVIITDHHDPREGAIPDCLVVNPKLKECNFPDESLSGVGVALYFLLEVRRVMREEFSGEFPEPNLLEDMDLVSIGTIADQVNLSGVNRVLTRYGLNSVEKKSSQEQHQYLKTLFSLRQPEEISSEFIAFQLAPLINACGRLENAELGLDYFLEEDESQSKALFLKLTELNQKRRHIEKLMFEKARALARKASNKGIILVYDPTFHEGVMGIVASKLVEEFQKPAIVFADSKEKGILKGSCRSYKNINIANCLQQSRHYLLKFGGHAAAAGCTLKQENLEIFEKQINSLIPNANERVSMDCHIEILPWMISKNLYAYLKRLEPFGQGNQKPSFAIKRIALGAPKTIKDVHLKWDISPQLELIYWNGTSKIKPSSHYDIVFTIGVNKFMNREKLQLTAQLVQEAA